MGTRKRPRPKKLGKKLKQIRDCFELSQDDMVLKLGIKNIFGANISNYERGIREPSYLTLLAYAKLFGISTDYLIDDELELPDEAPNEIKHPFN